MNKKAQNLAVIFKNPNVSTPKGKAVYDNSAVRVEKKVRTITVEVKEEPVYVNSAVSFQEKEPTASGRTFSSFLQTFVPLAACWLILLLIIIPNIYFSSVIFDDNTKLKAQIKNLMSQIEELKMEEKNLTEKDQILEKTQYELNVSRAQWSIDAYCPTFYGWGNILTRKCDPCQTGWKHILLSCYQYNTVPPPNQRTWAAARDDCRGKGSDLTAAADEQERNYVISMSPAGVSGYWMGLRAVNRTWKWIDGTNLTNQGLVGQPAADGQCVAFLRAVGWRSMTCNTTNAWICEKKPLSV